MLVSVIIPSYNRANIIGDTIDSVLAQTYKPLEIIIVDDGSIDNTEEVVNQYVQRANIPINYYKKTNGGCASARNLGLKYAKGDLIAFLDSDDRWFPETLEKLSYSLLNSQADFVYSPSIEILSDGREIISYPCARGCPQKFAVEHFKTAKSRPGAILYKKIVFDKVNGFDETLKYSEDSDLLQRVAINFKAVYSDFPSVKVYHHNSNKSNNRIAIYYAMLQSYESILQDFPKFKQSLGKIADLRIRTIKLDLLKLLILSENFEQANIFNDRSKNILNIAVYLCLKLHSKIPLIIEKVLYTPINILSKIYLKITYIFYID